MYAALPSGVNPPEECLRKSSQSGLSCSRSIALKVKQLAPPALALGLVADQSRIRFAG